MGRVNNRSRRQRRVGAHLLSLFATPINGHILRALAGGPLPPAALREAVGWPAPSTLRGHLDGLVEIGAVGVSPGEGRSRISDHSLTPMGEELLGVADALGAWLRDAPTGPIELGGSASKAAIRALVDGWDATVVRALAPRPLSLVELDGQISDLSYPALSRRLSAMRLAGLIEQRDKPEERGCVYRVTDWLRRAVTPLGMAARCELRHLGAAAPPVTWVDVECTFLLALPLVDLSKARDGECTFAVDTDSRGGGHSRLAGVRVEVRDGRVAFCSTRLTEDPATWALGAVERWLDAMFSNDCAGLQIGGEKPALAKGMVTAIRQALTPPAPLVSTA